MNPKPRPSTTHQRPGRRKNLAHRTNRLNEEERKRLAVKGGKPNALGITQGQNGEQGNKDSSPNAP